MRKNIPNLYKTGLYGYLTGSGRIKKRDLQEAYLNMLTLLSSCLHDYKTPDYNRYFYELAISTGVAAFYKCTEKGSVNYNKWCCTPARPASVIDNMLTASRVTTAGSDYAAELTVDKDCVLIYNNSSLFPDMMSVIFADDLTENHISMNKLVKWSRMTPIPKAKTDSDIARLTQIMQRIMEGEDINIVNDELDLLKEGHSSIDDNVLRLTDENAVEKLHFFDQHYDQLLKRYATIKGLPFSTTAKNAQSLVDELHDMDVFSTFLISDAIACRQEGFERAAAFMKKKYDEEFDFEYKPSELLRKQLERPAVEFRAEAAEALRIESEASQNISDADMREAQADKFEAEADKLEAEAEQTETETEALTEEDQNTEKEGEENEQQEADNTVTDIA